VRAFLAVPADPAWVGSVRRLVEGLAPRLPRASWTRPESWHLTLRFLGEISEEAADRFAAHLDAAAANVLGGDLRASGPALLPSRGRPRVLGVDFEREGAAETLVEAARAAEAAARAVGCDPVERPFRPHVTLARLRDPWPKPAVEEAARAVREWTFPTWRVRSMVLYRSRLDPAGAVHTPVREWLAVAEARA